MADLLRHFSNLKLKRRKTPKIFWVLGVVYLISIILSIPFAIYSSNKQTESKDTSSTVVTTSTPIRNQVIPTPTPHYGYIPEHYEIVGGTHNFQTFNNCGPSSLSMALSFYGISVSQKVLGDELRPYQIPNGDNDDKSVTLGELAEKSKDFGFVPYHRPNGDIEILKRFIKNDIPVITRTLTHLDEDIGHFRVIYGYNDPKGQIIQNDSLQGKGLRYDYDEFLALWKPYGYEYLVLVKPEDELLVRSIIGEDFDELTAWNNAVKNLEKEVALNPNDIYLKFSLSVAYYKVGNYEKSIETFERVESQLSFRTLWYQIEPLLSYQKVKRYDELIPRIDAILNNHNRAFSELYQIKGEIYLERGEIEAARKEFENAVYYNNNFKSAIESLNYLDNL